MGRHKRDEVVMPGDGWSEVPVDTSGEWVPSSLSAPRDSPAEPAELDWDVDDTGLLDLFREDDERPKSEPREIYVTPLPESPVEEAPTGSAINHRASRSQRPRRPRRPLRPPLQPQPSRFSTAVRGVRDWAPHIAVSTVVIAVAIAGLLVVTATQGLGLTGGSPNEAHTAEWNRVHSAPAPTSSAPVQASQQGAETSSRAKPGGSGKPRDKKRRETAAKDRPSAPAAAPVTRSVPQQVAPVRPMRPTGPSAAQQEFGL